MAEKTLNDLFLAHLKDIYYAGEEVYRTLPKMVKAANDADSRGLHNSSRRDTGPDRTTRAGVRDDRHASQAKPCEAINGILAEGEETIEEFGGSPTIDTGLVAGGAHTVEHYEMARYGALAGWATQLGMPEAARLLNQTLQEEMNAEKLLTQNSQEHGRQDRCPLKSPPDGPE